MSERTERRRWTAALAEDLPEGPDGQPSHLAGTEVRVLDLVDVPGVGRVSISVPRPSALLLAPAQAHLKRAAKLRPEAGRQVRRGKWVQPGMELHFTNEELVYDFLEEAMAGIVLAHAALECVLNELLPEDFAWSTEAGATKTREDIERSVGVERRLTTIASLATGIENVRVADPPLFDRAMELKRLRGDIVHSRLERTYGGGSALNKTVFSELFSAELIALGQVPSAVASHYQFPFTESKLAGSRGRDTAPRA